MRHQLLPRIDRYIAEQVRRYVDNYSFRLDLKILWLTVRKVLHSEGVSQAGQATMEEFRGTPNQGYNPDQ